MENAAAPEFCFKDLGRDIVLIEDVLLPQELERQRYQKNIVWWIAALNNVKALCQSDPPCEQRLPEDCVSIFKQVAERASCLNGRGMAEDADAVKLFGSNFMGPADRTDD